MGRSSLPILPAISDRYSPRAFSAKAVSDADLQLVLEAARWAPSSMNEQPWRFLVTRKDGEGHAALFAALNPSNQRWAINAPVLILVMAKRFFARNGKENYHERHDVGIAMGLLLTQATTLGMGMHILGGFHADIARVAFNIPEELDLVSVLVLGYPGDPATLPDDLRAREENHSARKELSELVHWGRFTA